MRVGFVEKNGERVHILCEEHMEPMPHFSPGANPMVLCSSLTEKGALGRNSGKGLTAGSGECSRVQEDVSCETNQGSGT